jgi:hypothetical protein
MLFGAPRSMGVVVGGWKFAQHTIARTRIAAFGMIAEPVSTTTRTLYNLKSEK